MVTRIVLTRFVGMDAPENVVGVFTSVEAMKAACPVRTAWERNDDVDGVPMFTSKDGRFSGHVVPLDPHKIARPH